MKRIPLFGIFGTLLLVALGCSKTKQTEEQTVSEPTVQTQSTSTEKPAGEPGISESEKPTPEYASSKPTSKRSSPNRYQASPRSSESLKKVAYTEPAPVTVEIPAGMQIVVSLSDSIDTGKEKTGDQFEATLINPIEVANQVIFPAGATVTGEITHSVSSGRMKTDAELSLTLTALESSVKSHPIVTDTTFQKGKSHTKRNIGLIGGGAAVGTAIGAITGKKKGALIGAAAGAAAGTGVAALSGKQELVYKSGSQLTFILREPLRVTLEKATLATGQK